MSEDRRGATVPVCTMGSGQCAVLPENMSKLCTSFWPLASAAMPVPWMVHSHRSYIPRIADRALTVKQLFDLRIFLQRLCKAKVLTRRAASDADASQLQWHLGFCAYVYP